MTAAAPVRKLAVNSVLPLLACIALLPSVWIFCGVHGPSAPKTEKAPTVSTIMLFADQPNQIGFRSQRDLCLFENQSTSLVRQQAENNTCAVAQTVSQHLSPVNTAELKELDPSQAYWAAGFFDIQYKNYVQPWVTAFLSVPWPIAVLLGSLITLNFGFVILSISRWF
ncbi:MAG: hypothetical protein KGS72_02895 [Cyanobacteria bacterium REEB67]|nr:hypothetical protein [Cyanobacteria bacterium REEB67]